MKSQLKESHKEISKQFHLALCEDMSSITK